MPGMWTFVALCALMVVGMLVPDSGDGNGAAEGDESGETADPESSPEEGEEEGEMPDFEDLLEEQPPEFRSAYESHTEGLRSALQSERESRRELERRVSDLREQAEEGSEAEQQLGELEDSLAETTRQSEFYEEAHNAGVTNLRLAWLALQSDESLVDGRGVVDYDKFREDYPELFRKKETVPEANAGSGGGRQQGGGPFDMNSEIRQRAGRQ